jgi:hypothetical protein
MFLLIEAMEDNDVAYGLGIFACWHYIMQTPLGGMIAAHL